MKLVIGKPVDSEIVLQNRPVARGGPTQISRPS